MPALDDLQGGEVGGKAFGRSSVGISWIEGDNQIPQAGQKALEPVGLGLQRVHLAAHLDYLTGEGIHSVGCGLQTCLHFCHLLVEGVDPLTNTFQSVHSGAQQAKVLLQQFRLVLHAGYLALETI